MGTQALKNGTHYVGYAYPTSAIATKLGRAKDGCWYLRLAGRVDAAFDSRDAAITAAKAAGTTPDRWSSDHPDNAR